MMTTTLPSMFWVMTVPMFRAVLLVGDVFHPVDRRAVQFLLDGDMAHRRGRRRPVPMLLARREPYDISRPDFLDRAALALDPAAAGHDDQGLTERMGMPCRPSARFEGDQSHGDTGRLRRAVERIDSDCSCEILGWPFAGRL